MGKSPYLQIILALLSLAPAAWAVQDPAVVYVNPVQSTELFDVLTYPARIIPKINTTLLAETDGIVSQILTPLGQRVSSRQKLMIINHTDPVYQYAPVTVLSPVGGIVSAVEVTEGSQVNKGDKLASVTDPSKIRITVEVPAQDLASLSPGLIGDFKIAGRDTLTRVKIRGISPFVDPATGTATCELEITQKATPSSVLLAPGLVGQVSFKANVHTGITIPDYAIVYRGSDTFVRVVENGKAKRIPIRIGAKRRGFVEIVSGISERASLVERASRFVGDGDSVNVQTAKPENGDAPK